MIFSFKLIGQSQDNYQSIKIRHYLAYESLKSLEIELEHFYGINGLYDILNGILPVSYLIELLSKFVLCIEVDCLTWVVVLFQIGPLRCWPGGLCLSRSIGDVDVGEYIVPVPYVKQIKVCS
jgi:hypothetical protein